MLANIARWLGLGALKKPKNVPEPLVIPRALHTISRANISPYALKVLYRLREKGYQAYLVGGGVRDLLLDQHPKDFDVATNATPEEVQRLFRNCRLIGRRFRLAHIHFGFHIVEVATFRGGASQTQNTDGMILRDNVYGTLVEDVYRRDFTVNALYYNIADFSLIDYVGGLHDLKERTLKMIGDPVTRYREDPVRMLRVIRFAAKLDFKIHEETKKPIFELAFLIKQVPAARLLDELMKLFLSGFALKSFELLNEYQLLGMLFLQTNTLLKTNQNVGPFIKSALAASDTRVAENKPVALPFLLAAFLWHAVLKEMALQKEKGVKEFSALVEASEMVLREQQKSVAISRRIAQSVKEIWVLQLRLMRRPKKRVSELLLHPRFRAAYDFLLLRAQKRDKTVEEIAKWWETYVNADVKTRRSLERLLPSGKELRGVN